MGLWHTGSSGHQQGGAEGQLRTTASGSPPVLEPAQSWGQSWASSFFPVSNIIKAAAREGGEGGDFGKPRKNFSGGNHSTRGATGLLRRKEVTEEEAER